MKLKVKKLHPDARIPTKAHITDSGMDLYALESVTLYPGQTKVIKTGVAFDVPVGYEIQVRPRSGLSSKTNFRVANSPGTIDAGYHGDASVIGTNISSSIRGDEFYGDSLVINKGDKIAQAVLCPVIMAELEEVDELQDSARGEKGFGSSGK